jgi:release factor glutamine methyltransferase
VRVREILAAVGLEGEAGVILDLVGGDEARALELARRRAEGTPLAYLVGRVRFLDLELACAPGALVPRPETEILARTAIDLLQGEGATRVVDMCCGAGNLACAIASHLSTVRVWASDLTDGCLAVARENVRRLGLAERVTLLQGDLFAPLLPLGLERSIDGIVCNPPYISSGRLAKERAGLLEHEPREAFDGGPYGLSIHQRAIKEALPFLRPGGWLFFEIGLGQDRQVKILFERARAYDEVRSVPDAEGQPRVVYARKQA